MKENNNYTKKIAAVFIKLAPKYGVQRACVFGSFVKGGFRKNSDIDLLVEFQNPIGFVAFIKLEDELARVLKRKVDLVTKDALSPYFREEVLRQSKVVYEKRR